MLCEYFLAVAFLSLCFGRLTTTKCYAVKGSGVFCCSLDFAIYKKITAKQQPQLNGQIINWFCVFIE